MWGITIQADSLKGLCVCFVTCVCVRSHAQKIGKEQQKMGFEKGYESDTIAKLPSVANKII